MWVYEIVLIMRIPPSWHADELMREVRGQFQASSHLDELTAIKFCLADGKQRLKQMREMLGFRS